ncbi:MULTISPECIES: HAD-IC family P-type ATPase [Sphingobium]|uniref:HAD ATPase, P-type, family IC n=1 Tax=Sphingobium yanoikuyae ATCC 51230 TaxID=883163 RepID=K9CUV8_SPHYA|nr:MULTISPECIES: HAD-IC family P-type ATPase [Sphingobium]EKU76004.1 HAD ATPase, P-type, family IC [Sphingobium yanoikuyae ATCC 51230]WQE05778.1 HAD-IC family P-type ATPase [Sphingobium yanoikuyae]SHL94062.1 ATPase, P-type (transporting), HAD superfamily, subfamily IC [Sphingobium sp. YR657]
MSSAPPVAWHALPPEEALATLSVEATGLDQRDAEARLRRYGPNALPEAPRQHPLLRFLAHFNSVLIYFLIGAALVALLLNHGIDAAVILAVVLVNAVVGFIQEGKAEEALGAIQDMIAPHAMVLRSGERRVVAVPDLVPGDIVLLEAGDRVPADIRLLRARGLLIDEAALTGESVAAEKHQTLIAADAGIADQSNMAFSGTLVAAGQATGLVVETGSHTQIGRISGMLKAVEVGKTPLVRQIDDFARLMTWSVLAGAVVLFLFAVLARGFHWIDALIAIVALSVGVVPEGLPAVITITLAIGVQRMAARQAVIRRLPAVETLGATSVICTDKTGTLTRNEMTVRHLLLPGGDLHVSGSGYAPTGAISAAEGGDDAEALADAAPILRCGLLCNDALLRQADDGWTVQGDPMEGALVALAMKAGLSADHVRDEWPRIDEIPFDAAYRFMATLHRAPDGSSAIFVKGAPEALLAMTGADVAAWDARLSAAADRGERLLGFAVKRITGAPDRIGFDDLKSGVELLGLMGFIDPPRDEARQAIAQCRSAGIAVKMITGDHVGTAIAIARQLALDDDPQAMSGAEVEALDDEALAARVRDVDVFARSSPEHKLRIVRALQSHGLVVAMTGDGVNDAPSLKQADVGTAMGIKGTEAAKEAAEMVLLDDNFASIVAAVREGRTVYDNIRKVISWTLPTNGGETLAVVIAIIAGFALPMTATQILWINLVLTVTLGLVLAFEPTEPGTMERRPRAAGAPLLSPFLLWRIMLVSVLMGAMALGIFFYAQHVGHDIDTARTMVVNMLIVGEIFYLFNVRFLHMRSLTLRGAMGTPIVLAAIVAVVIAQLLFTYARFMHDIFDSRPLSLTDGLIIIGLGAAMFAVLELEKLAAHRLAWFEDI